jgi:hypothetical protein
MLSRGPSIEASSLGARGSQDSVRQRATLAVQLREDLLQVFPGKAFALRGSVRDDGAADRQFVVLDRKNRLVHRICTARLHIQSDLFKRDLFNVGL